MTQREYTLHTSRTVRAPPAQVWALVADTNRWDRAVGLAPGAYRYRTAPDGARERVGQSRQWGLALEWVEPPYEWVEGRFIRGERRYARGPVARGGFRADLHPEGEGTRTRVEIVSWVALDVAAFAVVWPAVRHNFRTGTERYLDAVEALLAEKPATDDDDAEAAAAAVRRALWAAPPSPLSGAAAHVHASELAHRAARFERDAAVDAGARERLVGWLRERPDEDVEAMRPFELARAWGVAKREALRAFLHATRAGLTDLRWQVNCPVCRVGAETVTSLAHVRARAHCDACDYTFGADFAEHVEAVFRPSDAVRPVASRVYCASSPWFRPHVFAALSVAPGETRAFPCRLPRGDLLARAPGTDLRAVAALASPPARFAIALTDAGLTLTPEGTSGDGYSELAVTNHAGAARFVQVERAGWGADVALGSAVATFPDFLDLFATEAPAAGVELSVGTLAVLFSDLTGSTALYQRLGDARAFALIEAHFRTMGEVVARHGGAVVKTMGDAVMATFARLPDAVGAGLEMIRATRAEHGREGLALKVGVHCGSCLAVRANDRLDFFGTTVNLAARLQTAAQASQLVLVEGALAHPDVAALARDLPQRRFDAPLKGIRDVQALVSLDASADAG